MVIISCEEDLPDDSELRDEYLGTWTCSEQSTLYGNSTFTVQIKESSAGIGFITIENFYNEGSVCQVEAEVFDNDITISSQSVTGNSGTFTFQGSGTANNEYTSFSLNFTANDGAETDNVTASFSR